MLTEVCFQRRSMGGRVAHGQSDPSPGGAPPAASRTALRRVDFVRVTLSQRWVQARVVGVVHRVPREIPVSPAYAARLVCGGVPLVVRSAAPDD